MRKGIPEAEGSGGVADGEIDACIGTCGVLGEINGGQSLFDEVAERVLDIRKHLVAHHVLLPTLLLHLHIGRLYYHIHQQTEHHTNYRNILPEKHFNSYKEEKWLAGGRWRCWMGDSFREHRVVCKCLL